MTAQDRLMAIISREAEKLNTLSEGDAPLSENDLASLEVLCRCSKLLRAPAAEPEDEPEAEPDVAADLKALNG